MAPACRVVDGGVARPATWRFDDDALVVTGQGATPAALRLAEVAGISGDGFRILLATPRGPLEIDRLGADGPALLERLRREWPPLRARALRLGEGQPERMFVGRVRSANASGSCRGWFEGDLFIFAPDGADVRALFIPHLAAVDFDAAAYAVAATNRDGARTEFLQFAGATADLHEGFQAARQRIAREAAEVIGRHLPTLSGAARAALAAAWPPGRLLSCAHLESIAPGFAAAFRSSWLAASIRRDEGTFLMEGGDADGCLLGYRSPGAGAADPPLLWLLVRRPGAWFLEVLSHEDVATCRFRDEPALPALAGEMLCLPQFSREALALPLEELVGDRGDYAIAARELPLLLALRAAFSGRVLHDSPELWRRGIAP